MNPRICPRSTDSDSRSSARNRPYFFVSSRTSTTAPAFPIATPSPSIVAAPRRYLLLTRPLTSRPIASICHLASGSKVRADDSSPIGTAKPTHRDFQMQTPGRIELERGGIGDLDPNGPQGVPRFVKRNGLPIRDPGDRDRAALSTHAGDQGGVRRLEGKDTGGQLESQAIADRRSSLERRTMASTLGDRGEGAESDRDRHGVVAPRAFEFEWNDEECSAELAAGSPLANGTSDVSAQTRSRSWPFRWGGRG